jgi:dipeptidyl aminopeptidase/acylaminoacyl peptidase
MDGKFVTVDLPGAIPKRILSAKRGQWLVAATSDDPERKDPERIDWWSVGMESTPTNLTKNMASVPGELTPMSDADLFLGVVDGKLWSLRASTGKWDSGDQRVDGRIDSIAWHEPQSPIVVVSSSRGDSAQEYRVISGGYRQTASFKGPSRDATLSGYFPEREVAAFMEYEGFIERLVIMERGHIRTVVEVNGFTREIEAGSCRSIEYRSLNGESLRALLLLPSNYQPTMRYPMVTWVYPSLRYDACSPNVTTRFGIELLTAKGYAVLIPSMPLDGARVEPYMELTSGVLPAVDKVVDLGIADTKRVVVMGHSFGGFAVYGLLTLTDRFRAGIALAGTTNWVSHYGSITPDLRYSSPPADYRHSFMFVEGSSLFGQLPWMDLERYSRNSPIAFVERIRTPLLIIHGDLDFVPITQAEELFSAMYRQGKRVRFVRYWGEGHVIMSPANFIDMWNRIYQWLDECNATSLSNSPSASADR